MTTVLDRQKRTLVNKVGRRARARFGKDKGLSLERFIRHYYEHVPPQDIVGQDPANLLGAALAHWTFGAKRAARKAKVRVYNPRRKEHGWEADHTVVEIVNDDMPFLVDSVTAALNQRDLVVHLVIHPIFRVRRSRDGGMTDIVDGERGPGAEAFLRFEATRQSGERLDEIGSAIETVLADVRAAVEDWQTMRDSLKGIVDELEMRPPRLPAGEVIEARDFLDWTHDDHFTFLGYRDYDFATAGGRTRSGINAKTGLGILRDPRVIVFRGLRSLHTMPPEVRAFVRRPDLLMVTKSNVKSTVHRPVHLDVIGVKRFDDRDRVVGQRLFVGLFTSSAYSLSPREIPVLRRKLRTIFDRAGFPAASHTGKALTHILETYPRDELFQASDETLFEIAMGILNLQERQRVALFLRRDDFERFMSCLLYIPRDRYNTDLRNRMGRILEEAFGGKLTAYYTQLDDSPLARLHLIIQTTPGRLEPYDTAVIEERLLQAARSWSDRLEEALVDARGEEQGSRLFRRYRNAFPPGYVERFSAQHAITDIAHVEDTAASGELGMNLYRPAGIPGDRFRFKIYNPHRSVPLSDTLPMLEHMSLKVVDEVPHAVNPDMDGLDLVMIHDFGLETRDGSDVDLAAVRGNFQEAFRRVWRGEMESDEFNSLLLRAGLTWREVVVLRAYCKYLRQAGIAFSQSYMAQTLSNSPRLARLIVDLFLTLFDPAGTKDADKRAERIRRHLSEGLDAVESADEDRILRRFLNIVESSVRTNFFQRAAGGAPKPYLSIKLDSRRVDELPLPRPMFDVFVYSPRVEAIHLRGGLVARGGIRWSDRREDFRTEILGLMKAQTVKNAVIVPVGAKGGFVVKRPPAAGGREALLGEGIECYKTLMRGLLDISDNLKGTRVVRPKNVVRRDGDDPYLVVAADKGTATFSDIANGISTEYDFWLGDAFASGGSVGYDHKKMGITARGAWESVKRHFREVGTDIQNRGLYRRRRRRHVGRRLRQRHAVVSPHQADRRFQPPPHLCRSRPRPGQELPGAQAAVRIAAVVVDRLREHADLQGWRGVRAPRQVDLVIAPGAQAVARRQGHRDPQRTDPRPAPRPGGPVVVRRHRHLRQGQRRIPHRGGRPRQRRNPRQRVRAPLPGDRRGGQPGGHPAGPRRVFPGGRAPERRFRRQLGRSRLFGSRGEHQDSPRFRRCGRRVHRKTAQRTVGEHDRRSWGAGTQQQLPPESGHHPRHRPGQRGFRRSDPDDAHVGAGRPAEPGGGGPYPTTRGWRNGRPRGEASRVPRSPCSWPTPRSGFTTNCWNRTSPTTRGWPTTCCAISRPRSGRNFGRQSAGTACAARSSPPPSPTA